MLAKGVERHIGVSRSRLKAALYLLEEEGYRLHDIPVRQIGTGKNTSMLVLSKPGIEYKDAFKNRDNIKMITDYSEDHGKSFLRFRTS